MNPTPEQRDALQKFLTGESLLVEACAGSGKTTTLGMLAAATERRGLYLAFNKAIATEAKARFPRRVECRTSHSLAWVVGGKYQRAKRLRGRITGKMLQELLGDLGHLDSYESARAWGKLLRGIERFCQSARPHPALGDLGGLDPEDELEAALLADGARWLRRLWNHMKSSKSEVPIVHDVYLKLWALSEPTCPADYVLFDEAQDANGVILGLLELWEKRDRAQIVAVGDRYQQIYSWRGAVNAMERMKTMHTARLTQSWRYGQDIAHVARVILSELRDVDFPIQGTDVPCQVLSEPGERAVLPDAILTRTNVVAIAEVMGLLARGVRVEVAGGVKELLRLLEGVRDLFRGRRPKAPELQMFDSWADLVEESMEEGGEDLRPLVRLVEDYELTELIDALEQVGKTEDPQVTVSTAHRSKGLEWEHVRLASDFRVPDEDDDGVVRVEAEEAHLLYVAVTRARRTLDLAGCPLALYALERSQRMPVDDGAITQEDVSAPCEEEGSVEEPIDGHTLAPASWALLEHAARELGASSLDATVLQLFRLLKGQGAQTRRKAPAQGKLFSSWDGGD